MLRKRTHLEQVVDVLPVPNKNVKVDLLISRNFPKPVTPKHFVRKNGGQFAVLTFAVCAMVEVLYISNYTTTVDCHRTIIQALDVAKLPKLHFVVEMTVKQVVTDHNNMFQLKFNKNLSINTNSQQVM